MASLTLISQRLVFLFALFCTASLLAAEKAGIPLTDESAFNLKSSVLCFPEFSRDHEKKILPSSGPYHIWSERRVMAWALAQGFRTTTDRKAGGYQYKRGAVFYSPGMHFKLYVPVRKSGPFGYKLVLDMAFMRTFDKGDILTSDFKYYENILRYDIVVDNILVKTIEIGYGQSLRSPVMINLPFIRDPEGKVKIEIRMKHHPHSFGILYDAFLTQQ